MDKSKLILPVSEFDDGEGNVDVYNACIKLEILDGDEFSYRVSLDHILQVAERAFPEVSKEHIYVGETYGDELIMYATKSE